MNHRDALLMLALSLAFVQGCTMLRSASAPDLPLTANVIRISDEFANINTDVSGKTLAAAGIDRGSMFRAHFGDESIDVFFGDDYGDVDRGKWVGLIETDGKLQLAVSFGHAATVLGCDVGDHLLIAPLP